MENLSVNQLRMAEVARFETTIMALSLDDRVEIVEMFTKDMKERKTKEPDILKIATQWYNQKISNHKVESLIKVFQWIYQHRYRIVDHQLMRDHSLATNIYKWKDIDGKRVALYDDYEDWTYYTEEEKSLLRRECRYEADAKYRRKYGHK